MSGSVLLIHISESQSQAIGRAFAFAGGTPYRASAHDVNDLLDLFARTITAASPVQLCVENESVKQELLRRLPHASSLSWQNEMAAVRTLFADKAVTHIGIANGVYALLDEVVTAKVFAIHTEYRADISYAENLPPGMALNYVSRDLLESLDIMEAKDADLEMGIRQFVEKNINQFHAEVHYEEPDLRLLRLDFSLTTDRSIVKTAAFARKLANNGSESVNDSVLRVGQNPYAALQALLHDAPELLHTFPSYVELEFSATAEAVSFFSPLGYIGQSKAYLSRGDLDTVRAFIAEGLGDTCVCASGLGEPLEHPDALAYLSSLLDDVNIRYVFVETNGIHLGKLLPLAGHAAADKLRVIVLLNSLDRYEEFSGAPKSTLAGIRDAIRSLTAALTAAGKNALDIVHLQAFKVEENETEIDSLYALAEELGATFLLQKYNRYAGLMPERRVSDMTPLERYSCWHLRRDLFIRANGDVAFCKQTVDLKKATARGNLTKDSLKDLWASQRSDFGQNFRRDYPQHLPCASCDEYFTFNF